MLLPLSPAEPQLCLLVPWPGRESPTSSVELKAQPHWHVLSQACCHTMAPLPCRLQDRIFPTRCANHQLLLFARQALD